jgi:TIR domain
MKTQPKAFISYSHQDREIVTKLAESLRANGIDTWFDRWELVPGDSLVHKIFSEGLSGVDAFIIVLSPHSIQSKWVQEELGVAMIKRIEGITRIIPVVIGDVSIPDALRPLLFVKLTNDFDSVVRDLQKAIFQVYERPPIGQAPEFVRDNQKSVGGLSPMATRLGLYLAKSGKAEVGIEEQISAAKLSKLLSLTPEETDDAIDELVNLGLATTLDYMGTTPFSHGHVEPTYALFLHFVNEALDYNPEDDIKAVASVIVAKKQLTGRELADLTELSPLRINRAVAYLEDSGLITAYRAIGTGPFNFLEVHATGATRSFAATNAR